MKHFIRIILLILLSAATTLAQSQTTVSASADSKQSSSVNQTDKSINLQSGTQLMAELQNTIDARKAKAGQQVILKTTQAIKAHGQEVVKKGAKLFGHITEVKQKSSAEAMSSLSIVFDKLESGSLDIPISATITSITQAMSHTTLNDQGLSSDTLASSNSRTTAPSPSGGGGLLGGVTQTVGGVLNTTTQTVGGVTGATTDTVGRTTGSLGSTLSGIQITQSSNASAEGNSTLWVTGGNLRLEKGTSIKLSLTKEASISKEKQRQRN
jgi:hypothetical protein